MRDFLMGVLSFVVWVFLLSGAFLQVRLWLSDWRTAAKFVAIAMLCGFFSWLLSVSEVAR